MEAADAKLDEMNMDQVEGMLEEEAGWSWEKQKHLMYTFSEPKLTWSDYGIQIEHSDFEMAEDAFGAAPVREMSMAHRLFRVDYCAYLGVYMKPTNIWSNVKWEPKGWTGNGRCSECCGRGMRNAQGRWVHEFTMGQASNQAAGGMGRRAMREQVPHELHWEMLLEVEV